MKKALLRTISALISKPPVSGKLLMKKTLFFASCLLVFLPLLTRAGRPVGNDINEGSGTAVKADKGAFVLKGKITGLSNGYVYLSYTPENGGYKTDSALLKKGEFKFEGSVSHPVFAVLTDQRNPGSIDRTNLIRFYLEPGVITLTAKANELKNARITGSGSQQQYEEFERSKEPITLKYKKQLDSLQAEEDHERSAEIRERLAPYFSEMDQMDYRLFAKYPGSYVTAFMLRFHVGDLSLDSLKMFYDRLGNDVQQSESGKELASEIQKLEWGSPGSVAKDFTATDINGNKLSLSDFKGKYVLLDFWASWCVPCRKGNPHLRELYAKYKDKGIEFIGISDDDSKPDAWRQAVEKDQLPWRHVLRGFNMEKRRKNIPNENDISEKFGIHTLPTKILIDRDGKIIGRYSSEEGPLDEMLKKIFGDPQTTTVSADITGLKDTQVAIAYYAGTVSKIDTVKVTEGRFTWQADMPEPQQVGIMFSTRYFPFFAEAGSILIKGTADSLGDLKVTGSKTQEEAEAYERSLSDLTDQEHALYQKYGKVSREEQLALEIRLKELRMQKRKRGGEYIAAHPKSAFSINLVSDRAVMGDYGDVKAIYEKLDRSARESDQGRLIAERLKVLKRSAVGEQVLDFAQKNADGKQVRYADFKGKYVLIDFWASWCGPCRAENPNVLKAYNRYKDNNFTVVGISLDDKEENWKKAIREDKMPWTQLSDLKGWENEVSTYYGIRAIPSTLLIDPGGKIIAKDLRGEMLNQKLAELFN